MIRVWLRGKDTWQVVDDDIGTLCDVTTPAFTSDERRALATRIAGLLMRHGLTDDSEWTPH